MAGICKNTKPNTDHLKVSKYRKPRKWKVQNRILYGLMKVDGLTAKMLGEMVGVHRDTVARWIYKGVIPKYETQEKVSKILKMPIPILFGKVAFASEEVTRAESA